MDNKLASMIDEVNPKFNPRVANGIVTEFMTDIQDNYIARIFQASQADYPEDLKFRNIERVDPHTDYLNRLYDKSHNIAKSDTYMVKVQFDFKGKPLPPYHMSLPFVREAGLITINGSNFLISPVLIDEGLSVGTESIFIHVNKDKITFMREHYAMNIDDKRENGYVIYSDVYNGRADKTISMKDFRRTRKMKPLVAQYLFAKKGVEGAFKDYLGVDVKIGKEEINTENYPVEDWVICSSVGVKPFSLKGAHWYAPKNKLAIKRADYNLEVQGLAMSLFYNLDHFYIRAETEDLNETITWKLFLGMTLRPEEPSDLIVLNSAERNLNSLDTHLDAQVCASLATIDVIVFNIYDLFLVIMKTFTNRIVASSQHLATMYGKRMTVQRYILRTITEKIFRLGFKLQAKKKDKNLKEKDVNEIIKMHIGINDIGKINHQHAEVESANNPTDNIIPTLTSRLVLQKDLTRDNNSNAFTPDMFLDASIGEIGNLTATSGDQTGRSRINMFAMVDTDGTVLRNPELYEITSAAQRDIHR